MSGLRSQSGGRAQRQWAALAVVALIVGLVVVSASPAQTTPVGPPAVSPEAVAHELLADEAASPGDTPTPGGAAAAPATNVAPRPPTAPAVYAQRDPTSYGLWVLAPAGLAILLAIAFRQVVPALAAGVLLGAYLMYGCLPPNHALVGGSTVINGFRLAVEDYGLGALKNPSHLMIIVFTLGIGFLVGVIGRNGGTAGLVRLVAGRTTSRRRGMLTAWLGGLVVFFDDYANSMIVGPTLQPVFDRIKLSRAKLAYIVDSTAAPVASLALIGTWVGAEIGYIQEGIDAVTGLAPPAFLVGDQGGPINGMGAFIGSLPFRFYPLLALVMVLLVSLTGRDFGPMKRAEGKALGRPVLDEPGPNAPTISGPAEPRWAMGLFPILVLVGVTLGVLCVTGWHSADTQTLVQSQGGSGNVAWADRALWDQASVIIRNADSYLAILYGALLAATFAVLQTLLAQVCSVRDAVDAGVDGMSRMFPAVVVLTFAWALSEVSQDLQLGAIVAGHLRELGFTVQWLPLAVFASAALISFATGTSWGTMGILCPATVEIAARLIPEAAGLDLPEARTLFYAAVGAVLAGAVFGDHCSPISDTTVLSSIASGCRLEEHVWTQGPYALVTAVVAMGLGDVLCSRLGQPWYVGLAAGSGALLILLLVVGRSPQPLPPDAAKGRGQSEPADPPPVHDPEDWHPDLRLP